MSAVRGVLLLLLQILITPLVLLLMIPAMLLGAAPTRALARNWCRLNVAAGRLLGLRYRIEGAAPASAQAVVVLAKHSSAWETFFIMSHFPQLVPVVKRELLSVPFFGWGLALLRPIAIDRSQRGKARAQLEQQGCERLQHGLSVLIFPEGTRIPAGERGRYASGGAALAIAAGVPVVALAHDAGYYWRKSPFDKRAGEIRVRLSPPLRPAEGEPVATFNQRVEDWIEAQIESFGHPPARRRSV